MGHTVELLNPEEAPSVCEPLLRSLPAWFGLEDSLRQYVTDAGRLPTWGVRARPDALSGIVTIREHFAHAAEIHLLAVAPELHGHGVGTLLLRHVEQHLAERGYEYLQVSLARQPVPRAGQGTVTGELR